MAIGIGLNACVADYRKKGGSSLEEEVTQACGACGGSSLVYLGALGNLAYFRCQDCGMNSCFVRRNKQ